jgi:hypothetical protein
VTTVRTVEHIVEEIRRLPGKDRRKLMLALREVLKSGNGAAKGRGRRGARISNPYKPLPVAGSAGHRRAPVKTARQGPYAMSLALAGTMHSDLTDVSTDKYKHVAEACADRRHEK